MTPLSLIVFDVDGTLVDSQDDIVLAMQVAFDKMGQTAPACSDIRAIIGLSLEQAFERLAPDATGPDRALMVETYKAAYMQQRAAKGSMKSSPLFPGAKATLDALNRQDETLLGVATGKSRRGLDVLLDGHGLRGYFVTEQVADHHPSKPHPSMLQAALVETGVAPRRAVMVGDTCFDMEMAKAAGILAVAVSWGYHGRDKLTAADHIIDSFDDLMPLLTAYLD